MNSYVTIAKAWTSTWPKERDDKSSMDWEESQESRGWENRSQEMFIVGTWEPITSMFPKEVKEVLLP